MVEALCRRVSQFDLYPEAFNFNVGNPAGKQLRLRSSLSALGPAVGVAGRIEGDKNRSKRGNGRKASTDCRQPRSQVAR